MVSVMFLLFKTREIIDKPATPVFKTSGMLSKERPPIATRGWVLNLFSSLSLVCLKTGSALTSHMVPIPGRHSR